MSRQTWVVLGVTAGALALHLLWFVFLAGTGGDLAAQDAWTTFALDHPASAYDFAWYGGLHPASYSLVSPYVMSVLGVRATMVLVGTLSTALVAILLGRMPSVANPALAAVYAALAMTGNAVSGRVTFGLGLFLGLGAVALVLAWRRADEGRVERRVRGALVAALAGLATAASPVAGLFLGLVAAALWLRGRRRAALALGVLPALVVATTAAVFPFSGVQPMSWRTAAVPLVLAAAGWWLLPRRWRLARVCSAVYAVAVVLVWVVPTPIGTNVSRLSLLFGGVVLVAAASGAWWTSPFARRFGRRAGRGLLGAAIVTATGWQFFIAGSDVVRASSATGLDDDVRPLVAQLEARGADLGRVEVVPTKSHREASALAAHVNLARGWNRQADVARNPMFYRDERPFTASEYRRWLHVWAVRFVVLPASAPDYAGLHERTLVRAGLPYLREVWSDPTWSLYEVVSPTSMATAPGSMVEWDSAGVTVDLPEAGSTTLRVAWSPWLSIVDESGSPVSRDDRAGSCLAAQPVGRGRSFAWVVLHAATPGTYRIAAPYVLPRGTACPEPASDGE